MPNVAILDGVYRCTKYSFQNLHLLLGTVPGGLVRERISFLCVRHVVLVKGTEASFGWQLLN